MSEKLDQNQREMKIIHFLENFLHDHKTSSEIKNNTELKKILENTIDRITTVMYELQTNLYYLVVIGGVKSGKSTLINVLSGEKSATTNLGIETTLYPSIISHSSKNEIITYRRKIGCNEGNAKLIELILNNIKGLPNAKETMEHCIDMDRYDFDDTYIQKFVATKYRDESVVLVNIKIKSDVDSLISDNIAIIDTPGIDGAHSSIGGERERSNDNNEQEDGLQRDNNQSIGNLLIQKSTYMIFVQSSIAPITHDNLKFIQGITHPRHTVLVHNKFSINQWRKFEEDLTAQKRNAKQILENAKIKSSPFDVDLGKAHDAIFRTEELKDGESYEKLLEDSKIINLKKDIIDSIKLNGKKEHIENQINDALLELEKIKKNSNEFKTIHLQHIKNKASGLNSNFEVIIAILDSLISSQESFRLKLLNKDYKTGYTSNQFELQSLKFPFPTKLEKTDEKSKTEDKKHDRYAFDTLSKEMFLEKELEFKKAIVKRHNTNISNAINIYEFNNFINEQKQQNETMKRHVTFINEILDEINANQQVPSFQLNKSDIKSLEKSIVDIENIDFVTVGQNMKILAKMVNLLKSNTNKDQIIIIDTKSKIENQLAMIESKFDYDEELIELLYSHVTNYKSKVNELKNDIMQDFENKYFRDSLDNFSLVDDFIEDFKKLITDINNVE